MLNILPPHRDIIALVVFALLCVIFLAVIGALVWHRKKFADKKWRLLVLFLACAIPAILFGTLTAKYVRIFAFADRFFQPAPERARDDQLCAPMRTEAVALTEDLNESGEKSSKEASCSLQTVLVPDPVRPAVRRANDDQCWPTDPAKTVFAPLCYQIAFLELNRDGDLLNKHQLELIERAVRGTQGLARHEVYTIAFVHGWRHGAGLGDSNIRSLRLMASYAAAHLQERCRVASEHCGAKVLAIYVSWPASIVEELSPDPVPCWLGGLFHYRCDRYRPSWGDISAVLTFASRKRVSDALGPKIIEHMWTVRKAMAPNDHLVLIGHSLGGNAVLTGAIGPLREGIVSAAKSYDRSGAEQLKSTRLNLPTDLLVLFNPASEARKLVQLRSAIAASFAVNPVYFRHSSREPKVEEWLLKGDLRPSNPSPTGRYWPASMPPRVLIFAARCGPNFLKRIPNADTPKDDCDNVVHNSFPTSQMFAEGLSDELLVNGIGHLAYGNLYEEVSTSHDIDVNGQCGPIINGECSILNRVLRKTKYASIFRADQRCMIDPDWLYRARAGADIVNRPKPRDFTGPNFTPWDAGPGKKDDKTLNLWADVNAPGQSNIQFAYPEIARRKKPPRRTPAQSSDPIWAVQANPTFITTHSAIVSAPVFCALTKLVLDRPGDHDVPRPDELSKRNLSDFKIREACDLGELPSESDISRLYGGKLSPKSWQFCVGHARADYMR